MTNRLDPIITVQGASIDLGEALPRHVRESIARTAAKYFGHLAAAAVYFSRDRHLYRCTVNIQMGALDVTTGEATQPDCYRAFAAALDKAAKQLRRRKRLIRESKPWRVDKDALLRDAARSPGL